MKFRLRFALWVLGFSVGLTVSHGGQPDGAIAQTAPSTVTLLPFIQWCQDRAKLPDVTRRTVDRLLQVANTEDCDRANRDLSQRIELNLSIEFRYAPVAESERLIDLRPLAQFTNLQRLSLSNHAIADLAPLATLTRLRNLSLGGNQIIDLSPLAQLTNLEELTLTANQITNVAGLANLTKLRVLTLAYNQITDISPLANLTNLEVLDLFNNQIHSIQPLARLSRLTSLSVDNNQIRDLAQLSGLTQLNSLSLASNQITDLRPLSQLINLSELNLADNRIVDPTGLPPSVTRLNLTRNQIRQLTPLATLVNLQQLSLIDNQIVDLAGLEALKQLQRLDLESNQIRDVRSLAQLNQLSMLLLADNQIVDIQPLAKLNQIRYLSLLDNPLRDRRCPVQPERICIFSDDYPPYGRRLSRLWDSGFRLEETRRFTEAKQVYQQALITAQTIADERLRSCAIAHSQIALDIVTAIEQYINDHPNDSDPTEGIEITRIQQNYASWETVGRRFQLSARDCPKLVLDSEF